MSQRAALYARVSTARQEQEQTVGSQIEALARIIHHGAEEGHSAPRAPRNAPRRVSAPPKRCSSGPRHANEAEMGLIMAYPSHPALRRRERCARAKARAARRVMP